MFTLRQTLFAATKQKNVHYLNIMLGLQTILNYKLLYLN